MHPWPTAVPPLALPSLAPDPRIPAEYYQLIAGGQWPHRWFLPTAEPTSWALDGVAIHALLAPAGPGAVQPPLTADLVPFTADGSQFCCFDFATTPPRIRYVDLDVDQWLVVADSFADWWARLTWRPPVLAEPVSAQQLAHALLVADGASLPALFDWMREARPAEWAAWLPVIAAEGEPERRAAAVAEAEFARRFLAGHLTPAQRLALARVD